MPQRPFSCASLLLASLLAPLCLAQETTPSAPTKSEEKTEKVVGIEAENRPIAQIRISGLKRIPELLVRNQIRLKVGEPYLGKAVEQDIKRITELGRFDKVIVSVESKPDGSLILSYQVSELPLLETIEIIGAKTIKNDKLRERIRLRPGDPIDRFLLDKARMQIIKMYEDKGHFETKAEIDEAELLKGNLRLSISEGARLRLRDVRFEGNTSFPTAVLESELRSDTYMFIFSSGYLEREQLELDADRVRDYYHNRGWLDAQVGRRIDISKAQRTGVCTFVIDEGPRYAIKEVQINFIDRKTGRPLPADAPHVFTKEQIASALLLHPGDPYEKAKAEGSIKSVEDMYGKIGHLGSDRGAQLCKTTYAYHRDKQSITLVVTLAENKPTIVGKVDVIGNENTQTKVVQRDLQGMTPGRYFDRTRFDATRENLSSTPYFAESSITLLGNEDDAVRDAVVQVKEKSTGSVSFGVGVSSDLGLNGNINYTQRNFDITDVPYNWDDLWSGHSFRGAGQTLSVDLQPGVQYSNYGVSFVEPSLLESDNTFSASANYSIRPLNTWTENRTGFNLGVGRRFGRLWTVGVNSSVELVNIDNVQGSAPTVAFDYAGLTTATSLGFNITRSTVDSFLQPGHGMKDTFSVDRYGALGWDVNFTRLDFKHQQFWTLEQDFMGRKTTIGFRGEVAYIPETSAPFFYDFYAGGSRTLRGFEYRGVGPFGDRQDGGGISVDNIGGRWMTLASLEYSTPIYQDIVRWVVFTDQGTLTNSPGRFDDWRISVGTGLRIKIPFLSQAPLALDFAFPLKKATNDKTQIFSFDFSLPLQ